MPSGGVYGVVLAEPAGPGKEEGNNGGITKIRKGFEVKDLLTLGMITPTVAGIFAVIALIIFGPGKLPQVGKGLGRGIKEFKTEVNWDSSDTAKVSEKKQNPEINS